MIFLPGYVLAIAVRLLCSSAKLCEAARGGIIADADHVEIGDVAPGGVGEIAEIKLRMAILIALIDMDADLDFRPRALGGRTPLMAELSSAPRFCQLVCRCGRAAEIQATVVPEHAIV